MDTETRVFVLISLILCNWTLCLRCVNGLPYDVLLRVVCSLTPTPTAIGLEPTISSCLLIALIVPVWPTIREMDPCALLRTRVRNSHIYYIHTLLLYPMSDFKPQSCKCTFYLYRRSPELLPKQL